MSAKVQNPELMELLAHARKVSREIATWPEWKKGPIGVDLYPDNVRRNAKQEEKDREPRTE